MLSLASNDFETTMNRRVIPDSSDNDDDDDDNNHKKSEFDSDILSDHNDVEYQFKKRQRNIKEQRVLNGQQYNVQLLHEFEIQTNFDKYVYPSLFCQYFIFCICFKL